MAARLPWPNEWYTAAPEPSSHVTVRTNAALPPDFGSYVCNPGLKREDPREQPGWTDWSGSTASTKELAPDAWHPPTEVSVRTRLRKMGKTVLAARALMNWQPDEQGAEAAAARAQQPAVGSGARPLAATADAATLASEPELVSEFVAARSAPPAELLRARKAAAARAARLQADLRALDALARTRAKFEFAESAREHARVRSQLAQSLEQERLISNASALEHAVRLKAAAALDVAAARELYRPPPPPPPPLAEPTESAEAKLERLRREGEARAARVLRQVHSTSTAGVAERRARAQDELLRALGERRGGAPAHERPWAAHYGGAAEHDDDLESRVEARELERAVKFEAFSKRFARPNLARASSTASVRARETFQDGRRLTQLAHERAHALHAARRREVAKQQEVVRVQASLLPENVQRIRDGHARLRAVLASPAAEGGGAAAREGAAVAEVVLVEARESARRTLAGSKSLPQLGRAPSPRAALAIGSEAAVRDRAGRRGEASASADAQPRLPAAAVAKI